MLIMLEIDPLEGEKLAINSLFECYRLLAQPNELEKFLSSIKTSVLRTDWLD